MLEPDGGTFHPNRYGQQALAALIACYLNSYASPPTPFIGPPTELRISPTHLQTPADLGLMQAPGVEALPSACR